MARLIAFLSELTRRRVWLFGGIYLALGWVLLQVAIAVETTLSLPGWVDQITLVLLGLGFPVALLLAWAQESRPGDEELAPASEAIPGEAAGSVAADRKGPPSIAVLPFDNLSDDPDQAWFAEGMTEDLITLLASISRISVTARISSSAWKGTSPDVRVVGAELNVNYVVEGSIRRVGDNVRVTAQLVETSTGNNVWAEKYDRPSTQLYDIQDEVIVSICNQVGEAVLAREFQASRRTRVEDMDAWALLMRAESLRAEATLERLEEQEDLLHAALELEPDFAMAVASLAAVYAIYGAFGFAVDIAEKDRLSREAIDRAVSLAPDDPFVIQRMAVAAKSIGDLDATIRFATRGIELAPSQALFWSWRGIARALSGDVDGGEKDLEQALALGRNDQFRHYFFLFFSYVRFAQGRFDEMEDLCGEGLIRQKEEWLLAFLVVARVNLGRIDDARRALADLKARRPDWTLASVKSLHDRNGYPAKHTAAIIECLKQAGME